MPKIDAEVMEHRLTIDPKHRPVNEKVHSHAEEVDKLLKAGFIWKVSYPNWICNVVLIKKANSKCVSSEVALPSLENMRR